jgi:hypothetical protein
MVQHNERDSSVTKSSEENDSDPTQDELLMNKLDQILSQMDIEIAAEIAKSALMLTAGTTAKVVPAYIAFTTTVFLEHETAEKFNSNGWKKGGHDQFLDNQSNMFGSPDDKEKTLRKKLTNVRKMLGNVAKSDATGANIPEFAEDMDSQEMTSQICEFIKEIHEHKKDGPTPEELNEKIGLAIQLGMGSDNHDDLSKSIEIDEKNDQNAPEERPASPAFKPAG